MLQNYEFLKNGVFIPKIDDLIAKQKKDETEYYLYLKLQKIIENGQIIYSDLIPNFFYFLKEQIHEEHNLILGKHVRNTLDKISNQLKIFDNDINDLEIETEQFILNNVTEINTCLHEIIVINKKIKKKNQVNLLNPNEISNDIQKLFNQRKMLVRKLNSIAGIKLYEQNNDFILKLKNIVLLKNNNIKEIFLKNDEYHPDKKLIGYKKDQKSKTEILDSIITQGSLSGILKFRKEKLQLAENKMGQLLVSFTHSLNTQQLLGYDYTNHPGNKIFEDINPSIIPNQNNQSQFILLPQWEFLNFSKPKNYDMLYLGNNQWVIKNTIDDTNVSYTINNVDENNVFLKFEGLKIQYEEKELCKGDKYLLEPTKYAVQNFFYTPIQNVNLALFETNDIKYENFLNAKKILSLENYKLINNKETIEESYENYKKTVQYEIADLELKQNTKTSFQETLINDVENSYLNINIQEKINEIRDLKKNYSDINQSLNIQMNTFDSIMNILNK